MDNYKRAVKAALKQEGVNISVGDVSVNYFDLKHSAKYTEIIEACEATEFPRLTFYTGDMCHGQMAVMCGEGDESIVDYHVNPFMDAIASEYI
jgi:hypothetical protein